MATIARSPSAARQRRSFSTVNVSALRTWHAYVGMFIAPMLLFFSLTGCLQIFDLHEARAGYDPGPVLAALGRLHKNQVLAPPPARPKSVGAHETRAGKAPEKRQPPLALKTVLLKWLFFAESLAVAMTTLVGLVIGLRHAKRAKVSALVLAAGVAVPVVLLVLP